MLHTALGDRLARALRATVHNVRIDVAASYPDEAGLVDFVEAKVGDREEHFARRSAVHVHLLIEVPARLHLHKHRWKDTRDRRGRQQHPAKEIAIRPGCLALTPETGPSSEGN